MAGEEFSRMRGLLRENGIFPASYSEEDSPAWDAETGHHFVVHHSAAGGWGLSAMHLGDPSLGGIHVPLGHDDETAAQRVAAEMRHPETLGHLRDMYQRARLNNDPTGQDPWARRVPQRTGEWLNLHHYQMRPGQDDGTWPRKFG